MILDYSYWYFVKALPPHVCDSIVEIGLERMHAAKKTFGAHSIEATTGDWRQKDSDKIHPDATTVLDNTIESVTNRGQNLDDIYIRDSHVSWINEKWMYDLIWPFIHEANAKAGWNFQWDFTEDCQFTKYGTNQFYGWHADAGPKVYQHFDSAIHTYKLDKAGAPLKTSDGAHVPEEAHFTDNPNMLGKIRKLSVTISLSDPSMYDGGNLNFDLGPHRPDRYHECIEIRPQGSIIIFPSHVYHQVTPITRGTRYSLVAWNLGYPFK